MIPTTADAYMLALTRQTLAADLAELQGTAARVEDVSASEAIRKAGMYTGLVAADLAALPAAGPLTADQLRHLGDVQRALLGILTTLDQAAAEVAA